MIILYLFTLFGFAYLSTLRPQKYGATYIFNSIFNQHNVIDVGYFGAFMPANIRYIFRMEASTDDDLQVKCYVYARAQTKFDVNVCAYSEYPSDEVLYNTIVPDVQYTNCRRHLAEGDIDTDGNYDVYIYYFSTMENVKYLGIGVLNYYALDYLSIYVYSRNAMTVTIILLIIFLPLILVIGLVVFLLRKCGCIVTISSSSI